MIICFIIDELVFLNIIAWT